MSTSKKINKICISAISIVLALTILFMNGETLGMVVTAKAAKYESTLFDTSYVHQIDIVMNDWDSFIESCEDEEYASCTVVIDGEKHTNIAIRAKGNTSLSNVKSLGSQRYSFKLEFDHYEDAKTLDGLDKLCLNNLIQDNTMMKDYLVYQMMADFGVDTPLCSFAYLTVNGEDWGLYLAVEGVEDSFLSRNYGSDTGELYKPDSMSFGGGRGNGKDFDMNDFDFSDIEIPDDFNSEDFDADSFNPFSGNQQESQSDSESSDNADNHTEQTTQAANGQIPTMPDNGQNGQMPTMPNGTQGGQMPSMPDSTQDGEMPSIPDGTQGGETLTIPDGTQDGEMPSMPDGTQDGEVPTMPDGEQFDFSDIQQAGGMGGGSGMGSDDVKLQYIDDDPDSYSNIFDNAKTDTSAADEERLIESLKKLSSYEDLEDVLDMEEVLRYFVVHNFVCNGDSYTGSMIHNYYLHESDGQLGMIPWDYNLAFGTFQGGDASSSVNADIDNPVSGGNMDDRPMVGWIFSDEEYTELYHELFGEFIEKWFTNGELEELIADTAEMIRPYVEKDPTKFCTLEEFDAGVTAISQFVTLRGEAVSRQLNGDDTAVDTENLNLSDMGTMGNTIGGGMTATMPEMGGQHGASSEAGEAEENAGNGENSEVSVNSENTESAENGEVPVNDGSIASGEADTSEMRGNGKPDMQIPQENAAGENRMAETTEAVNNAAENKNVSAETQSDIAEGQSEDSDKNEVTTAENSQFSESDQADGMREMMQNGEFPQMFGETVNAQSSDKTAWLMIGVSALILAAGLIFAAKKKY